MFEKILKIDISGLHQTHTFSTTDMISNNFSEVKHSKLVILFHYHHQPQYKPFGDSGIDNCKIFFASVSLTLKRQFVKFNCVTRTFCSTHESFVSRILSKIKIITINNNTLNIFVNTIQITIYYFVSFKTKKVIKNTHIFKIQMF